MVLFFIVNYFGRLSLYLEDREMYSVFSFASGKSEIFFCPKGGKKTGNLPD